MTHEHEVNAWPADWLPQIDRIDGGDEDVISSNLPLFTENLG